jgi:hypothetical protein
MAHLATMMVVSESMSLAYWYCFEGQSEGREAIHRYRTSSIR